MPPSEDAPLQERLRLVEERLTFQQQLVEELNGVILGHEQRLTRLGRELERFAERMRLLAERSPGDDLPHEKPPHY